MMSMSSSWYMPGLELAQQFITPPQLPAGESAVPRRSVGSSSAGSEEGSRDTRRNFHRKVRTGCATCKVRHVKCDEAKPACRRCTSTGRKCDGYPALKNQRQNAPLLPRSSSAKDPVSIAPSKARSSSVASAASAAKGTSDSPRRAIGFFEPDEPLEQRYLDMFHHDTLPQIWRLEISQPQAWRRLVMQLVQSEPAVRQSAIALAAAHERQKLVAQGVRDDPNKLALAYYNKAIHHITENAGNKANSTHDPVVLLTMCLLFVAIEMFLNRDGPTRIHIQSGVRILQEVRFAEHAADEKELISASLRALDSHAAIYPGWGASRHEVSLLPPPPSGSSTDELLFADLSAAIREYYRIVGETNRHTNAFASDPAPPTENLYIIKSQLLADAARWRRGFAALRERDGGISTDQEFLANLLEISLETSAIVLKGAFDASQTEYDALMPEMARLTGRLAGSLQQRDEASSNFSVDTLSNEVHCLWYLFTVCRDPTLRRRMRELVWIARARRGAWCTMSTHLVMGRLLEIEEGDLCPQTAADVPAERRVLQICMDVAGARRDVRIMYRRAAERPKVVEEVLKHPPRPSHVGTDPEGKVVH